MSDSNFKPGDVVQLKSGGSMMTVLKIADNEEMSFEFSSDAGDVVCQWENKGKVQILAFNPHVLKKADNLSPAKPIMRGLSLK